MTRKKKKHQWKHHAGYPSLLSSFPTPFSALVFALGGWPSLLYLLHCLALLHGVGFQPIEVDSKRLDVRRRGR